MTKNKNNRKSKNIVALTSDSKITTNVPKQPMQWERELVGSFLLEMANSQVINARTEWYVDKISLRRLFEYKLKSLPNNPELREKLGSNGAWNIGSLLHRTNFLVNTPRGDLRYRIKSISLMDFRKEQYNDMDEKRRHAEIAATTELQTVNNCPIKEDYELDENAETIELKYQKTRKQEPITDFQLDSLGCFICQKNFDCIEKYEDHVEFHNDESDFQSLKEMTKLDEPLLKLTYQTCKDSHYFGFTLTAKCSDIIIDKFIIVQSRQFYYVYNGRLPMAMPASGKMNFFVDSHVFVLLREQPIVIAYSYNNEHFVSQHHFMRTEALPKPTFAVNPYRLSCKELFRPKGRLAMARPPNEVVTALKNSDTQLRLTKYNVHYRNYCANGQQLTQENMCESLKTLLQVEDIERLQHYVALKQTNRDLHQFGKDMSVKMKPNSRNINVEDVISPYDDVLIINERVTTEASTNGGVNSIQTVLENNNLVLKIALMDFEDVIRWARTLDEQFGTLDKSKREPRVYFARVISVSAERVTITCERFLPDNARYTLIFRPVRLVIRYQYRALELLNQKDKNHVKRLLFPDIGVGSKVQLPDDIEFKLANTFIRNNPEQMQAVRHIATCKNFPAPYIIFGPPGTGKTATICEAIFQLFVRCPDSHVLVLAGSNAACDEVALRLLRYISKIPDVCPNPLTRIFSATCDRRIDNIDDLLLDYSNMYSLHFYPHVQSVHQYRIVICTLSLAGKLSTGGFASTEDGRSVFTHVFVDEAAASSEADVLMGITCTIGAKTNLILSGDHKQLGPVLQSQHAKDYGLGLSLLERLLDRSCYKLDDKCEYNVAIQTRLKQNYRSHPQIVALYNELYYNNELQSMASLDKVCMFKNWFHTTNEHFPILFHSVFGTVSNTKRSASLCNNKEVDAVMDYVKDLMYFGVNGCKISQHDIGIISPYKSQYQRIQEQLTMRKWPHIDCGSVELFQGKEKQVIIVSFVRSFTPRLGFLDNTRRLNVILSRPISLLILIGNPRTLSQNSDFRHIIEKCRINKTLVGSPMYGSEGNNNNNNEHKSESKSSQSMINLQGIEGKTDAAHGGSSTRMRMQNTNPFAPTKLLMKHDLSEIDRLLQELPNVPHHHNDNNNHDVSSNNENYNPNRAIITDIEDLHIASKDITIQTVAFTNGNISALQQSSLNTTMAASKLANATTTTTTATTFSSTSRSSVGSTSKPPSINSRAPRYSQNVSSNTPSYVTNVRNRNTDTTILMQRPPQPQFVSGQHSFATARQTGFHSNTGVRRQISEESLDKKCVIL